MKLDKNEFIAGFPILTIRSLFKQREELSNKIIQSKLKVDNLLADEILNKLQELGYLTKYSNGNYGLTIKARSLAMAHLGPPINRAKADKLYSEFINRVKEVNNNEYYLYKVSKVELFGSYITQKEEINDIDIVVQLKPKESNGEKHVELVLKRSNESNRTFGSHFDCLYYPEKEVILFLRSRSKYLSLHSKLDGILEIVNPVQVYP